MGDTVMLKEMGKRISARRQALHLTQEQVAERMDVSIQMISNLEQGKKAIRPENLLKLSRVLEISADYILSGQLSGVEATGIASKFLKMLPEHQLLIGQLIDSLVREQEAGS